MLCRYSQQGTRDTQHEIVHERVYTVTAASDTVHHVHFPLCSLWPVSQLTSLTLTLLCTQMVKGEPLTGSGLAQLVEDMVAALNSRDIPTSASLLDTFNEGLVVKCSASHAALVAAVHLPTSLVRLACVAVPIRAHSAS